MRLTPEQLNGPFAESWKVAARYFGSDHMEVIDNILDMEDRMHFYRLEAAGLLEMREELNYILTAKEPDRLAKEWRTHYWRLKANGHESRNELPLVTATQH